MKPVVPESPRKFEMFIDGKWHQPVQGKRFVRHSPAHDVPVTDHAAGSSKDAELAINAARKAFDDGRWSSLSGGERAAIMLKTGNLIRENLEELALIETLESGKPISQSRDEISGAAGLWEYAAGLARTLHGESFNNLGDDMLGLVTREPVGVVGIIIPWNFPFFILSERLPFVLAAGCTAVVKPSELTSGSTLILARILEEAGLPAGVVNIVTGTGPEVGAPIAESDQVDMITFTGSGVAGKSVLAASAENFKKVALELGGKNPHIIFNDADLDAAADAAVFGVCFNAGQCCVSGSRLIVHEDIKDVFSERIIELFNKVRIGDPLDQETQVGAIASDAQYSKILSYIEDGVSEGAALLCGGSKIETEQGSYIQPTLFSNIQPDMKIYREEIFGPVMTISTFSNADEAVKIANDTCYGLAGSVWSSNIETALQTIRRLKAGRVWVNTTLDGGPELPVGGFKQSGYGRDCGIQGVEEYTQIKSTHIRFGERNHWVK